MKFDIERIKNMPSSAKAGVGVWFLGWVCLLATYYYFTKDTDWVLKLSIAVVILAVLLSQAQNWARLISVMANIVGILLAALFFYKGLVVIASLTIILFGCAIYFLMISSTASYFKAQSKPPSQPEPEEK